MASLDADRPKRSRPQELEDHAAEKTDAINKALDAALDRMRADRKLPATQQNLADLAGCSRGTVNSRSSVLDALRVIKEKRRESKADAGTRSAPADLSRDVKDLKEKLHRHRDERLGLVHERDSLKRQLDKLQKLHALLSDAFRRLEVKLVEQGAKPSSVVHLPSRKTDG